MRHDRLSREDLESFETTYNAACLNIAKGAFKQSEVLLNRAQSQHLSVLPKTRTQTDVLHRYLPDIGGPFT